MTGGRSDADRGNIMTSRDDMISISKSQSLLMKKELDHLSQGSGHFIGLNVVDRGEPIEAVIPNQHSRMNLKQIVSRGQIHFPKNALSIEELISHDDPVGPNGEEPGRMIIDPDSEAYSKKDQQRNNNSVEEVSVVEILEEDDKEELMEVDDTRSSNTMPKTPKIRPCQVSKESVKSRRAKSPIVYYKNPGFGKRFACKIQESTSAFPGIPLPGGDLTTDIRDDHNCSSRESYKDSTLFLFPPVLSESKLSLYDDQEGMETLDEDVQKDFDQPIEEIDAIKLATEGISGMDEIRDYNLQLKVLHDAQNVEQSNENRNKPAPQVQMRSENLSSTINEPQLPQKNTKRPEKEDQIKMEINMVQNIIVESKSFDKSIPSTPKRSFAMREIPESSWISLPARLYAESEQMPYNVMIFLAVIVLLFGLMGKFFFSITDWIAAPLNDEDEFNPSAMLEH